MRPLSVFATVFAACVLAAPAYAQSGSDTGIATELFNAGRDLMKAGNFAGACPKLAESARLDPRVGTLARLAECEEKLGQLVNARAYWQQALNLARVEHDDRQAHVVSELARIDTIVPKLKLVMVDGQTAATVKVDDLVVGAAGLGLALPVEPGSHTVTVTATGKKPWSVTLTSSANGAVTTVTIPALQADKPTAETAPIAPPSAGPPPTSEAGGSTAKASPWRTVGLVTAGVGVIGVGVGAVFGVIAKQKLDQSNAQPGGCDASSNCPPAAASTRSDARSAGDLSTIFFVAGGVLTAGGVALWLLAPKPVATSASVSATPVLGSRTLGLSMRGSF